MSNWKNIAKNGWHPKNDRGVRETINGLRGKGGGATQRDEDHHSAPLSTLKDPTAFGPPPKHHAYHGTEAASPTTAPTASKPAASHSVSQAPPPSKAYTRGDLGAPMASSHVQQQRAREEQAVEEETKPAPPPVPYRADTTGLRTDSLPKPPVRRVDAEAEPTTASDTPKARPAPPPRPSLPPRQNSHPDEHAPPPPPPYGEAVVPTAREQDSYLNKSSVDRLGKAGVSVPGFGIGRTASPDGASAQQPAVQQSSAQMNELQARFAKMSNTGEASPPSQGTSWQQKQKAYQTASNFQKDPSAVTMADARSAASTADNFRQRHGDQVASGLQRANGLSQKYGGGTGGAAAAAAKKAPPPPPPPKKPDLVGEPIGQDEPPPVPLASKPR